MERCVEGPLKIEAKKSKRRRDDGGKEGSNKDGDYQKTMVNSSV